MEKAKMLANVLERLKKQYPGAKTALLHKTPFELLVATVLSAQSTDVGVNKITPALFSRYPTPADFANAPLEDIEKSINRINFYKTKAKRIKEICEILITRYNLQVPKTMEDLTKLPGVARKTANIVLAEGYGIVKGIAVDTHVKRLSGRLGLTDNTAPEKIEQELMAISNKKDWRDVSNLLIFHGRSVCFAKKPNCRDCILNDVCTSAFKI